MVRLVQLYRGKMPSEAGKSDKNIRKYPLNSPNNGLLKGILSQAPIFLLSLAQTRPKIAPQTAFSSKWLGSGKLALKTTCVKIHMF